MAAWDIPELPWASEVAPVAYSALGLIENRGGVVEVGDAERGAFLDMGISEVALTFQPVAKRRTAIRRYLDAPSLLKEEIFRMADLIWNRAERSGAISARLNPERNVPPPTALQELLFRQHNEQQGRCGLCGAPMTLPALNKLLQMSTDRIDSLNPGYQEGSVLITHLACNLAKSDTPVEAFELWLAVASGRNSNAIQDGDRGLRQ